jgi:SAM-dependent methyltransferase
MDDPTGSTRATYDVIAAQYLANARDRSDILPHLDAFARALPAGALVIDLGAGHGIDTALLAARGLRAVGLDLSRGMLRSGVAEFPGPRVQADARRLPLATASVDGVWANASLLHLTREDAERALDAIRRVLRPGALLHLSLKEGSGTDTEIDRYGGPRFFQYWSDAELDGTLAARGFEVRAASTGAGPRNRWLTRLARRRGR